MGTAIDYAVQAPGLFRAVASYSGLPAPSADPNNVALTLAGGGASAEAMWGPLGGPLWIAHDPSKNIDKLRGVAVYAAASGGGQGAVDRLPDGFGNNFAGGLIEGIVAANTKIFADAAAAGASHQVRGAARGFAHLGTLRVGDAGVLVHHGRPALGSADRFHSGLTNNRSGVVVGVGAQREWELGWWDPLGVAVGEFLVVQPWSSSLWWPVQAKVSLSMSVPAAGGPFFDVVHLAEVARGGAAGAVQPRSLACSTIR